MKNFIVPQILQKAPNCFYIAVDAELNVIVCNDPFQNIFDNTKIEPRSFLSLFPQPLQEQWKQLLQNDIQETLAIPIKTDKLNFNVEWSIKVSLNEENIIEGYEILGVVSQKGNTETLTPHQTILASQEKRFRSVLNKLKKVLSSSLDIICVLDPKGKFTRVSHACKTILGYESRELVGKSYIDFVHEEDVERTIEAYDNIRNGLITTNFENRYYRKDRSLATLRWSCKWEEEDQKFYCIGRDATEKKAAEEALKISEKKYRILFENHPLPMWIYDVVTYQLIEANEAAVAHYGYSREELLQLTIKDLLVPGEVSKFEALYSEKDYYLQHHRGIWMHRKKNNEIFYSEITSNFIEFNGVKAKLVLSIDRTEQLKAEKELAKTNERYKFLSQATFDAIWDADLKTNEVQWGEGVKRLFPMGDFTILKNANNWLNLLHHEDRERVEAKLYEHFKKQGTNWEDEFRFKIDENTYKYISARGYTIYDENKVPARMIGALQDLTERKAHENMLEQLNFNLEKRAKELSESNAELERFAYVTSHDLQEPLRMVSSFLQLLERRYKDKLDQKAHEYISYAVDGAERMKRLILDLLEYSRVNSSVIEKEDVDVNEVIEDLRLTYKNLLQETGGTIFSEKLPLIKGNKTQILQLFQNLIGNAFKYRSERPPEINISYKEDSNSYKFSVTDNGIGIDPKFFQKIFIIFQRLHKREQYSGTGIGLAICKKIVDKHGGKIWVSSAPDHGSTFYFTIPKSKGE